MSQDSFNQPQDVQESDDHSTTMPLNLENTINSNSSSCSIKPREGNVVSNQAKPPSPEIGSKGSNVVVVDRMDEAGEKGDRVSGNSDRRQPKSKSSSDGSDHELMDTVPGSGEGGSGSRKGKGKRATEGEHQMHIWTERERRKKMKDMFSSLQDLLPDLPEKVDKATIVGETVNYIVSLQATLAKLEKLKLERMRAQMSVGNGVGASAPVTAVAPPPAGGAGSSAAVSQFQTWSGPNVVLNLAGNDAVITMCARRQPGILTTVVGVLEKHGIVVVAGTVSADQNKKIFNFHVRMNGAPNLAAGSVTVEDMWKLAVSELMVWLSE